MVKKEERRPHFISHRERESRGRRKLKMTKNNVSLDSGRPSEEIVLVVLLYGESRCFELIFLQYGASALMQTDNFSVGAIMKIVKKS